MHVNIFCEIALRFDTQTYSLFRLLRTLQYFISTSRFVKKSRYTIYDHSGPRNIRKTEEYNLIIGQKEYKPIFF